MKAEELFSAAIRVIGLLSLGRGLNDLVYVLLYELDLSGTSVTAKAPNADLVYGIFFFFVGLYFLRGAPIIVNYAFPNERTDKKTEGEMPKDLEDLT